MTEEKHFEELLERYLSEEITASEYNELMSYIKSGKHDERLKNIIHSALMLDESNTGLDTARANALLTKILLTEEHTAKILPLASSRGRQWKRWTVAAAVIVLLVSGYLLVRSRESGAGSQEKPIAVTHDVPAPTKARATLKLQDGRIVYLDSASNGTLAKQGNVSVVKLADGKISYESTDHSQQSTVSYNTITNPRGSKIQSLTLIDGTQVWLNAESSITYPTAFVGSERKVTITGEADFVVKHNEKMPFKVIANGVEINDVGTEFNVNAYNDEDAIKVTLLEGSIDVKSRLGGTGSETSVPDRSGQAVRIKPGEQVVAVSNGKLVVNKNVDVEQVMAWKNGKFSFNKAGIETVMKELGRWYDLDVEYSGAPTKDLFGGDMQRDLPLSKVLDFLKQSQVHFEVEGKKVIVKP